MNSISDSQVEPRAAGGPAFDRRQFNRLLGASTLGVVLTACAGDEESDRSIDSSPSSSTAAPMAPTQTPGSQAALSPDAALTILREGNARFVEGRRAARDLASQVRATAAGQYPFAVVLGCIDSRVPPEVIFDQGIGDVFSARVAGNVVNSDLLGSMEFACRLAGSKAVVVLGHTACGAVQGAISAAELGNLTGLVRKIEPAIAGVDGERDVENASYVDAVAETNVRHVIAQIRSQSPTLAEMEAAGEVALVGAMYDVSTGQVRWL